MSMPAVPVNDCVLASCQGLKVLLTLRVRGRSRRAPNTECRVRRRERENAMVLLPGDNPYGSRTKSGSTSSSRVGVRIAVL
jgi:hypothetical protein